MKLTLTNPQFVQMVKLGRPAHWIPKTVKLECLESKPLKAKHKTAIKLYPEQVEVFDQIKDHSAALTEALTGAGKTIIGIALHEAWGGRTLVVCHSLNMVRQTMLRFTEFTDIKPTKFCQGKKDQTGEVVVTTMTTFRKKYEEFTGFDNLIVDEADLAITFKMVKAINEFKATRKHGFTGTTNTVFDECNKEHRPVLGKFWGKHVELISTKAIPLKHIKSTRYVKKYPNKFPHHDWQAFREALDDDIDRKRAQLAYIIDHTIQTGHTLVLVDRVADVGAFYEAFKKKGLNVYMSTGEMKKQDREDHLDGFDKNGGYLFGVNSTLNRGYDQVKLSKAFILFPIKGENQLRQIIGRILRHYGDKESTLYLWNDSMLDFQFEKQKFIIKKFFNLNVS